MKKQKTAVEFLYEFVLLKLTNEQQMQFEGLFHQAKQIEKDQIESAFLDGYGNGHSNGLMYDINEDLYESKISDSKQYYESKYGKDENKAENND